MKTHKSLSDVEKNTHQIKSGIDYNHNLFNSIIRFVFERIHDSDTLHSFYNLLDSFVEDADTLIQNSLKDYESNNKENTD